MLQTTGWHRDGPELAHTSACWVPLKSTLAQLLIHQRLTITFSASGALKDSNKKNHGSGSTQRPSCLQYIIRPWS